MKKYNYLMFGIALGTGILGKAVCASAYTSCVGGTEITTNVYGTEGASDYCTPVTCPVPAKKFCLSLRTMNWWSAFNWCRSNGGTLASFASMCPGVATDANNVAGACPALQGMGFNHWVWSSLGSGTASAFIVNLSSGAVASLSSYRYINYFAFCE